MPSSLSAIFLKANSLQASSLKANSLKAVRAAFALNIVLLSLATVASAGPKEDVAAATSTWAAALGEDDPDKVLPLYADDAVFWGTLSPTLRADRTALRDYS
jgi:hypothetical protein